MPAGSVFAFLAEHRHRLFSAAMIADLFARGGVGRRFRREVVASVIVLQTLHELSGMETAEATTFGLRGRKGWWSPTAIWAGNPCATTLPC